MHFFIFLFILFFPSIYLLIYAISNVLFHCMCVCVCVCVVVCLGVYNHIFIRSLLKTNPIFQASYDQQYFSFSEIKHICLASCDQQFALWYSLKLIRCCLNVFNLLYCWIVSAFADLLTYARQNACACATCIIRLCVHIHMYMCYMCYGVATISMLLKIIGLFCRISSLS